MEHNEIEIPRKYLKYKGIITDPATFEPVREFVVHSKFVSYIKEQYNIHGSYVDNHELVEDNNDYEYEYRYMIINTNSWDLSKVDEETTNFFNILDNKPYKLYFKMVITCKDRPKINFTPTNIKSKYLLNTNTYGLPVNIEIETDSKDEFSISTKLSIKSDLINSSIQLTASELLDLNHVISAHIRSLKDKKIIKTLKPTDLTNDNRYSIEIKE